MDDVVRANRDNLRTLKIGLHRSLDLKAANVSVQHGSQTTANLARLEEYVSTTKPLRKAWILPLFVVIGMSLNMPYAALNGAIVYFSDMFGPSYYLNFLAAFNIPAIPLLTAQLLWDERIDKRFGSRITFTFRLVFTFAIMAACTVVLPYVVHSYLYVILLISIIGIANGIAFGSIFQLGAIFSNKGTACIFAGLGLGNLFTTAALFLLKFDDCAVYSTAVVFQFFEIHGGMVGVGIIAIALVMLSTQAKNVLAEKDKVSRQYDPAYQPLIGVNNDEVAPKKKASTWRTNMKVLVKTWKSQAAMYLTYFTGVIITTFVAYVPSVGHYSGDGMFVLLALYINIYGDFLGKNLTFFKSPIKTELAVLIISFVRSAYVVYFFLYITVPNFPRNDIVILTTMGVIALLGGYLTNLIFTVAPKAAPSKYTQQVASVITLILHMAVYSSIGVSFALQKYITFIVKSKPVT